MKFKHLIIVFNIIIIFFLSSVAVLPSLFMGPAFTSLFWRSGWVLALVLVLALAGLNVFFGMNYRLFKMLEREDWPALVDYLEQSVIGKGRYSGRRVRLLINAYLLMSDSPAVLRLENRAAIARPALVEANALVFGAAHILGEDPKGAADFFRRQLGKGKPSKLRASDGQWLRWYYGFCLLLSGNFDQAETEFKALAAESDDAVITGLSAYFLSTSLARHSLSPAGCQSLSEQGRERVQKALKNAGGWQKEAAKIGAEIHTAIIKKYIDEAGAWLFS